MLPFNNTVISSNNLLNQLPFKNIGNVQAYLLYQEQFEGFTFCTLKLTIHPRVVTITKTSIHPKHTLTTYFWQP
jgi:hypothetical protein